MHIACCLVRTMRFCVEIRPQPSHDDIFAQAILLMRLPFFSRFRLNQVGCCAHMFGPATHISKVRKCYDFLCSSRTPSICSLQVAQLAWWLHLVGAVSYMSTVAVVFLTDILHTTGCPFGGIVFAVEVCSTYFQVENLPRMFFVSITGSLLLYLTIYHDGSLSGQDINNVWSAVMPPPTVTLRTAVHI